MSTQDLVRLGDVVNLKRGYDLPESSRIDGPYPVISSSGSTGFHSDFKAHSPGVVIGRYGALGTVFFVEMPFWPLNTTLYVEDFRGNDERWVAALLESLHLERLVASSAVPGINRNHVHLLEVRQPCIEEQVLIGRCLRVFDELIENNRRRIELLEETARLLYREWFVNFRYPGHEDIPLVESELGPIPQGWKVRNLFELADVGFGFSFKSKGFAESGTRRVVRIRDVPNNTTSTWTDEAAEDRYVIDDGDTLIGMDGNFHMCIWADGPAYLNQRVARIRTQCELAQLHLHLALEAPIERFNETIIGTTVAHLGKRHLEEIHIPLPNQLVAVEASRVFEAIQGLQQRLRQMNTRLGEARDLLLPRLVSGDLDVSDLDLEMVV